MRKKRGYILFHPGHLIANSACSFEHFFSFVSQHSIEKLHFEFEPFFSYSDRLVFPLHQVNEWIAFQQRHQHPMILDTAHCFITCNALGYDFYSYFAALTKAFNPSTIHISTTDLSDKGFNDKHLHLADGAIDFERLLPSLLNRTLILEINDISFTDINYLRNLLHLQPTS